MNYLIIDIGNTNIDFVNFNIKVAIEVDGPQHDNFNKFFHNTPSGYLNSIKRDVKKYDWLVRNDFKVINIKHDEIEFICT